MILTTRLTLCAIISFVRAESQHLFEASFMHDDADSYKFEWPIQRVAIIGAGAGGLMAYREFINSPSFQHIRIFERDDMAGGNWHYTEEAPSPIPIANQTRQDFWKNDYTPTDPPYTPFTTVHRTGLDPKLRERLERDLILHRAPTPVWASLEANTPSSQQQIPDYAWPSRVPLANHQSAVGRYVRSFASWLGVGSGDHSPDVCYNTRVESVTKHYTSEGEHHGWTLLLRKLIRLDKDTFEESWWKEDFDAVVVASGRFNVPHIAPIPGLEEWQRRFPDRIQHARQYRRGEHFQGKSVVVVGGGVTSTEISRDVNAFARQSYLSVRPSTNPGSQNTPILLRRVPDNTTMIGEIKMFYPIGQNEDISSGKIELANGSILTGIDYFIMGTGYRYAFPFLPQYHNSSVQGNEVPDTTEQPIVTDGTHLRSLFMNVFYIDQPTLGFLNMEHGTQTFTYGKYPAAALARVWSGRASLPSKQKQWEHFWKTVENRGGLKIGFNYLTNAERDENLKYFIAWLNAAALHHGGALLDTPPDSSELWQLWVQARYPVVGVHAHSAFSKDLMTAILHSW